MNKYNRQQMGMDRSALDERMAKAVIVNNRKEPESLAHTAPAWHSGRGTQPLEAL